MLCCFVTTKKHCFCEKLCAKEARSKTSPPNQFFAWNFTFCLLGGNGSSSGRFRFLQSMKNKSRQLEFQYSVIISFWEAHSLLCAYNFNVYKSRDLFLFQNSAGKPNCKFLVFKSHGVQVAAKVLFQHSVKFSETFSCIFFFKPDRSNVFLQNGPFRETQVIRYVLDQW